MEVQVEVVEEEHLQKLEVQETLQIHHLVKEIMEEQALYLQLLLEVGVVV